MHAADAFSHLRAATRGHHQVVEGLLDLPGRCDRAGWAGYAAALTGLRAVHVMLQVHLDRVLMVERPIITDWHCRRGKPGWLTADLRRLPARTDAADPPAGPREAGRPWPALTDPGAVLGCLYVIEGSMLGGRTAAGQVRSRLGPDAPTRFFDGYRSSTASLWRSLRTQLAGWVDGNDLDTVIAGARLTFGVFTAHLAGLSAGSLDAR